VGHGHQDAHAGVGLPVAETPLDLAADVLVRPKLRPVQGLRGETDEAPGDIEGGVRRLPGELRMVVGVLAENACLLDTPGEFAAFTVLAIERPEADEQAVVALLDVPASHDHRAQHGTWRSRR
jgi:hypothetical protein